MTAQPSSGTTGSAIPHPAENGTENKHRALSEAERLTAVIATQAAIAASDLDLVALMQLITERAREITRASGATFELREGDEMVCHAASGTAAQCSGLRLPIDASLSGYSALTGEIHKCDDAETDPHVDQEACRKIGVRSFIVAPVCYGDKIDAVLSVLSPAPGYFDTADIQTTELMAGLFGAIVSQAPMLSRQKQAIQKPSWTPAIIRQETEQQVRLFDAALSLIADYVFICDLDGRITYANQARLAFWQREMKDVLGKNFFELGYAREIAERIQSQIQTVIATRESLRAESEYTGASGISGYYDYIMMPVFGTGGEVEAVACSTRDITVRQQDKAEKEALVKALQVERAQLQSLFIHAPAFIAVLRGPEHVFEMANPLYQQLIGHRDILGKTVREALPEIEGQGFFEILDEIYRTGTPFVGKKMRVLLLSESEPSLQERWLDFIYQPLFEANGFVSGIVVHGVDLTEHKEVERALQESKESLQLAIEGAQLGTFHCDVPFDKILWNDTCKQHFFLPQDAEVDFDLFYSLLHPDDREPTRQAIERCVNERVQYNVEYRTLAPNGRRRWINAIGRGYYTEAGEPYRFDGITIDITEKKARERTLDFLVGLNDVTREMHEPDAIMMAVARMLGEHLGANRCGYAEVEADEEHMQVYSEYINDSVSTAGRWPLSSFGETGLSSLRAGRTLVASDIDVVSDSDREALERVDLSVYRVMQIQALVCVPLIKRDRLVACMAVHQRSAREWTAEEIGLIEMVAERSWALLERARADKRAQERAEEIAALNVRLRRSMAETHHRVKNNLQVISAMIEMQMLEYQGKETVPVEEYLQLEAHIYTLAIVHELLTTNIKEDEDAQRISVKSILEKLLPMLQQTAWNKEVRYTLDDAQLTSRHCTSLSLVLNELVTNALKHGKKEAHVLFRVTGSQAVLEVWDDGPGFAEGFSPLKAANMGLELVESLIHVDLSGQSYYTNRPHGGGCVRVVFPLPHDE